ncbi:saccharopine dehydrogenase NADP-binding domain-containing protein [Goodfellowiella coeruleoviolacea]|uniref:Homospermidine synthase n=1 Tax=Goodfellowiella coeruleoviolacea TaxID=334858 RepID=A0AAE3GC90_9PSEU|nr:saccharopine dehydrogenase NADP-binding domain-containing protein [Goodfellowiella coeruleoviolacea]MCP2164739.1 homospermidine synthase (EC 2.5.1.44) [Goodfellowiella coeruleoviolacea]
MTSTAKLRFDGRVLVLGCGSVSQCLQPLLLRHLDMDFTRLTVMDFADLAHTVPDTLAAGASYVRERITPDNLADVLGQHLGAGDLLINLSWNIDTGAIVGWCHDHGVLYVDTSVEEWDPYAVQPDTPPTERTLYHRHMQLREQVAAWGGRGPTAVVEHGANPGLVSHWTKVALEDIATTMLKEPDRLARPLESARRTRLEEALADRDYARLAMETGTKVIHISERDTQIGSAPKQVGEFVNTWSVDGFYEEGIAPAELGWGTHEPELPEFAFTHATGPGNQICIARTGITTLVRSWVPVGGPIIGMVIRHGEAFTISDHLTVRDGDRVVYRPTVHYAYLPTDAAMASLHECQMTGYRLQERQRIMTDEIVDGMDELGVLLLGHDLNGWWVGSQLDIHEARELVPHQNATTLQVAASVLGAVHWIVRNPERGVCVPDDLDHEEVLAVANPYLGPCPSVQTDWTPRQAAHDPFSAFRPGVGDDQPTPAEPWAFGEFLVR